MDNEKQLGDALDDASLPAASCSPVENNGCNDSACTTSGESPSPVEVTHPVGGGRAAASECGRLHVEISDALSEKDKVKFTVHVQSTLPNHKQENHVVRQHEEFVWLHDLFEENEDYAGYIVSRHIHVCS